MKKLMTGIAVSLAVMSLQAQDIHAMHEEWTNGINAKVQRIKENAKERNLTEREVVQEVETLLRKHNKAMEKIKSPFYDYGQDLSLDMSFNPTEDAKPFVEHGVLINELVKLGDKKSLALFEEMAMSKNEWVSISGIEGYMAMSGQVNSFPFVERILKNPHCAERVRVGAYERLRYLDDDKPLPSEEDDEKIVAFLKERMQAETGLVAKKLDRIICVDDSKYRNSPQRMKVAERLIQSEKDELKTYWESVKEEIENPKPKVPKGTPWY